MRNLRNLVAGLLVAGALAFGSHSVSAGDYDELLNLKVGDRMPAEDESAIGVHFVMNSENIYIFVPISEEPQRQRLYSLCNNKKAEIPFGVYFSFDGNNPINSYGHRNYITGTLFLDLNPADTLIDRKVFLRKNESFTNYAPSCLTKTNST